MERREQQQQFDSRLRILPSPLGSEGKFEIQATYRIVIRQVRCTRCRNRRTGRRTTDCCREDIDCSTRRERKCLPPPTVALVCRESGMILTNRPRDKLSLGIRGALFTRTKTPINAGTYNGTTLVFARPLRVSHLCKAAKPFIQRLADRTSQARPSHS